MAKAETQLGGHAPPSVGAEAGVVHLDEEIAKIAIGEHPQCRVRLVIPPRVNADFDTFIARHADSTGTSAHRSAMKV